MAHQDALVRRDFAADGVAPDAELVRWCLALVTENMKQRHDRSENLPWCRETKLEALVSPLTRFVVLYDADRPVAFTAYQLTTEPDLDDIPVPCLYCYELQVARECRSRGLGSMLLAALEVIAAARPDECHQIMLTAFHPLPRTRSYRSPIGFYERHGFAPDRISPSQCLKPRLARRYDYEIMSKRVKREETNGD